MKRTNWAYLFPSPFRLSPHTFHFHLSDNVLVRMGKRGLKQNSIRRNKNPKQ